MAAAEITHLFACPELPPPSSATSSTGAPIPSPKLAHFIAYALHRTRLASCVTYAALFLLQRLKNRFPAARGSSGHRLFISAFMIASKVVCDDTYSNKSWAVVGQGMFQLREINQMEREMCGYLEWHLNIDYLELDEFTKKVQSEFGTGVQLPVSSSIAPASKPTQSSTQPRLSPSYDPRPASDPSSPATLITTVGDEEEDEEVESPSNSMTSSPASSALQTPPSNADIDGRDEAGVIISGVGAGMVGSGVFAQKQAPAVSASDAARIKASLSRDRSTFASAARW